MNTEGRWLATRRPERAGRGQLGRLKPSDEPSSLSDFGASGEVRQGDRSVGLGPDAEPARRLGGAGARDDPIDDPIARDDPIAQLRADRAEASARGDPMASLCMLASVGGGEPRVRTLVLRDLNGTVAPESVPEGFAATGFGLFLNRTSPKFREFGESGSVALLVYLPSLAVQYRLRCCLRPLSAQIVRESWQLRPSVPKRMDWLYERFPQSGVIGSREELVGLLQCSDPTDAPATAVGFVLNTDSVETPGSGTGGRHPRPAPLHRRR